MKGSGQARARARFNSGTAHHTDHTNTMTGNRHGLYALALAVLMIVAALATGPAAVSAQSEDSVVDTLFGPDSEDGDTSSASRIIEVAKGTAAKYVGHVTGGPGEQADAEQYAENVSETINANSGTLENWTNARATASESYDTVRVKFRDEDGGAEYLFITSDVTEGGEYTNTTAMNLTEFRDTGRDVDATYRLTPFASRNANHELETFVGDYAGPGEDLTDAYLANLAGEYRGEVSGDDLPGGDA